MEMKREEYGNFDITSIQSLEEFEKFLVETYSKAHQEGWINLYFCFSSREDYDGYSDPSIEIFGDRPATDHEKEEKIKEELVRKLSREKGISYHEAATIQRLKEAKKIDF